MKIKSSKEKLFAFSDNNVSSLDIATIVISYHHRAAYIYYLLYIYKRPGLKLEPHQRGMPIFVEYVHILRCTHITHALSMCVKSEV